MKSSKKYWIISSVFTIITIITLSTTIYFRPYPPIKPKVIPLGDYNYTIKYAQYKINEIMKTNKVPSIAVALIDDQETVWQKVQGYANIEEATPATIETFYRMGSISKLFTAIEIMRLVENGSIDLDVPLTDYIPNFTIKSRFNDSTPITIRSLLTHRSGLPRNGNLPTWFWDSGVNVLRDLTLSLRDSYMAYPVDYRFKYSNIGFDILGHIVEVLRGEYFAYYMRSNLLRSVGMNESAFLSQHIPLSRDIAIGYYLENRENHPINQYDIINLPSGNLYSTLPDMAEFAKFLFRGGEHKGEQIIQNSTLQSMFVVQNSSQEDPNGMGLGWFTALLKENEKVVYHSGEVQGTHSLFVCLPERKIGLILIGNSIEFEQEINQMGWELLELMLETKTGLVLPEEENEEEYPLTKSQLEAYTGKYIIDYDVLDFYLKRNKLKVNTFGLTLRLIPLTETQFKIHHWLIDFGKIEVEFFPGDNIIDDFAIINYFDTSYNYMPSYPKLDTLPPSWEAFLGSYNIYPRNVSIHSDPGPFGPIGLSFNNHMLMLGSDFYLKPISETEIILLTGPFVQETMAYDPLTGNIYWQNNIYKPI